MKTILKTTLILYLTFLSIASSAQTYTWVVENDNEVDKRDSIKAIKTIGVMIFEGKPYFLRDGFSGRDLYTDEINNSLVSRRDTSMGHVTVEHIMNDSTNTAIVTKKGWGDNKTVTSYQYNKKGLIMSMAEHERYLPRNVTKDSIYIHKYANATCIRNAQDKVIDYTIMYVDEGYSYTKYTITYTDGLIFYSTYYHLKPGSSGYILDGVTFYEYLQKKPKQKHHINKSKYKKIIKTIPQTPSL